MDNEELGGAASHARYSGAASSSPDLDAAVRLAVADLLSYLPVDNDDEPPPGRRTTRSIGSARRPAT